MVQHSLLTRKDYTFKLHYVLIKLLNDPIVEERLLSYLHDEIMSINGDMNLFKYSDFNKSIDIAFSNYYPGIEQTVKSIYSNFVVNLFKDPNILNEVSKIDQDILTMNDSGNLSLFAVDCITVLNMSTDKESTVLKINLHN